MYKKLSNIDINNIMKNIFKMKIFYNKKLYIEEFRQVYHKNNYYPYIISSFGRIFSIYYNKTIYDNIYLKEMKPTISNHGYKVIGLSLNKEILTCKIHILVAEAFIHNDNPIKNNIVNHKNGKKLQNYYWNLEWCDHQYNTIHAYKNGLIKQKQGEESNKNVYNNKSIKKVCELLENNIPVKEISKITGVSKRNIRHVLNKEVWTHISCNYNFDLYNFGKPKDYIDRVIHVCKLLEDNTYTLKEISNITNISYAMVKNILNKKAYLYISCKYNISNFNKYQTSKNRLQGSTTIESLNSKI